MVNLDTHIVILALTGSLRSRERDLLETEQWCVSAIVLWELAKLNQLGRIRMDLSGVEFETAIDMIHVLPITLEIAIQSCELDFSSDPADELIAATSIVHNVRLLTRDRTIRRSRLVPLA